MHRNGIGIGALFVAAACSAGANAQQISVTWDTPDRDRWSYPFNATPGEALEARAFGAVGLPGFDDRDGQFIVGWNTNQGDATIPAGEGAERYRVLSLTVTAAISREQWVYDPTFDSFRTQLDPKDENFVEDDDEGTPVELHATGYRGPFNLFNWEEDSAFGGEPVVPPAEGNRFIFAAVFDESGDAIDASNNVAEGFEAPGVATGVITSGDVLPGEVAPLDTVVTFEASLSDPDFRAFVAESLDAGKINLAITNLEFGSQDPGMFPAFWTKEDGFGETATLTIEVCVGARADWDCSGVINSADVGAFLSDYFVDLNEQAGVADFDGNGVTNAADVGDFLSTYFMSL